MDTVWIVNICKQSQCVLASPFWVHACFKPVCGIMFRCKLQQLPVYPAHETFGCPFLLTLICVEPPLLSIGSVSLMLSFAFSDISAARSLWCNLTPSSMFNASACACVCACLSISSSNHWSWSLMFAPIIHHRFCMSAWTTYRACALHGRKAACALNVEQTNIYWSWLLTARQFFTPWAPDPRHTAKGSMWILWKHACPLLLTPVCTVLTAWTKSPWTFGVGKIRRPAYTNTHKCACTVSHARLWKWAVRPALAHHSSLAANSVRPLSSLLYPTLLSENSIRG